jgi:microcystin degradation protein MlrC
MPKRVLLAGLFHETHTFLDGTTTLADFGIMRGDEILATAGDASAVAGAVETGTECGWEIIPAIDYRATPSAIVEDAVVESWWSEFESALQTALAKGPLDGIYLVLHGAMASQSLPDVEGELLQRIREIDDVRDVPIFGVTDLHANVSPLTASCSQGLITYRKNPHTDAKEMAVHAARLLDETMREGNFPVTLFAHPPIVWPPTGTGTADDPMKTLEKMARQIEDENDDILAVNVHAGFAFADTPETGLSFTVICKNDDAKFLENGRAQLRKLCDYALANKETGNVIEPPIESVMEEVRRLVEAGSTPVVLVEPSENVGGGAPGDGTGVLRALLAHGIENSGVVINDPVAVEKLQTLQIGEKMELQIGDTTWITPPLVLEVELVSRSDGNFDLEDAHSHLASMNGLHIRMGDSAVVKSGGVWILLTTRKTAPMDLGQWRSQGINPEELSVIGVKAAVAHRQAYDPISKASFTVSTPGPCASDLKVFPFKHLKRPIFPLDEIG